MHKPLSAVDRGMGHLEPTDPETTANMQRLDPESEEALDPNNLPIEIDEQVVIQGTAATMAQARQLVGGALGTRNVPQMEVAPGITGRDPTRS